MIIIGFSNLLPLSEGCLVDIEKKKKGCLRKLSTGVTHLEKKNQVKE